MDEFGLSRLPPHSLEAEQGVLGCVLWDPTEIGPELLARIKCEDFYDLRHREIFNAISDMLANGTPVDIISLRQRLKDSGLLDSVGGVQYLGSLQDSVPSPANFGYYAEVILEKSKLRIIQQECTRIVAQIYENKDSDTVLNDCEKLMMQLSALRTVSKKRSIKEIVHDVLNEIEDSFNKEGISGLATGFPALDRIADGLQKTDMVVIAARPSMGKTALAMTMAVHQAIDLDAAVGVFSLEMSANQLVKRCLSVDSRVSVRALRDGDLKDRDFQQLSLSASRVGNSKIYIEESEMNMLKIRSLARQGVAQYGWQVIYIDYIQLLNWSADSGKFNNRNEEMTKISNSIKAMAKELNIPVVVLCQLNRDAEKGGGQPQLSHLKDCGAIEQDADCVGFIYSDKPDQNEDSAAVSRMFKWAKDRNGEAPIFVPMTLMKPYTRFESRIEIDESDLPK